MPFCSGALSRKLWVNVFCEPISRMVSDLQFQSSLALSLSNTNKHTLSPAGRHLSHAVSPCGKVVQPAIPGPVPSATRQSADSPPPLAAPLPAEGERKSHLQIPSIHKLGVNQNCCTLTLILLTKIVLCSTFPWTTFLIRSVSI